jgi:hypothetical protein
MMATAKTVESPMEGINVFQDGELELLLEHTKEMLSYINSMPNHLAGIFESNGGCELIDKIDSTLDFRFRCAKLNKTFRRVSRDESIKRNCKPPSGYEDRIVQVPLVFCSLIPAPMIFGTVSSCGRHRISAKVPSPTPEAMKALGEHGKKFDHLELWWVPKDILIEKIPDPDPMLVGVVEGGDLGDVHFELCRWIDETVEDGWWAAGGGY